MKRVIRKGVFETNSSSNHSLSLKIKGKDERWKTEEEIRALDDNEESRLYGEIHREIRSKFAKIKIFYQAYVNDYLKRRIMFIESLAENNKLEFKEEYEEDRDYYRGSIKKLLIFDYDSFNENDKWFFDYTKGQLKEMSLERRTVRNKLKKAASSENHYVEFEFEKVDAQPARDDTIIDEFFGNSLLDCYQGDYELSDFARKLNVDLSEPKAILKLIDRMLEDDVYFETVESVMSEDTIPIIS